ncbi:hypothetical protein LEP1GSC066_1375 [Leptospira sp. serovar Kenya str. Sh9]|nr:hypothetical protein LEP1GSC066_1375 [Leptospira sp. serovar Kenya str. Sh9]
MFSFQLEQERHNPIRRKNSFGKTSDNILLKNKFSSFETSYRDVSFNMQVINSRNFSF